MCVRRNAVPWIVAVLCGALACATSDGRRGHAFMAGYMHDRNLAGTVVVESLNTGKRFIYDHARAGRRYPPASSFKIVNTLIALREGAVKNEHERLSWDGKRHPYPSWNRDHDLRSAFADSCVWFYQELARRVGRETYRRYLRELQYGNAAPGSSVDTFWLDGSLTISALEQIAILKIIHRQRYLFDARHYALLRTIMVTDRAGNAVVRGKTGTVMGAVPVVGWYVGYVETGEDTWFFACNLDLAGPGQAPLRRETVYRALREIGVM